MTYANSQEEPIAQLYKAAQEGDTARIEELLASRSFADQWRNGGVARAISTALEYSWVESACVLLAHDGSTVPKPENQQWTKEAILALEASLEHSETAGARVTGRMLDTWGRCALHRTTEGAKGLKTIERLVKEHHLDVDLPDNFGETPLMRAAARAQSFACAKLISLGADVTKINRLGQDAWAVVGRDDSFDVYESHEKTRDVLAWARKQALEHVASEQEGARKTPSRKQTM